MPSDEASHLLAPDAQREQAAAAYARADLVSAHAGFQRCIDAAREQGDLADNVACGTGLARTLLHEGDANRAFSTIREAAMLASRGVGDATAFDAFFFRGEIERSRHDPAAAIISYRQALPYVSGSGHILDDTARGSALDAIARAYLDLRKYADAGRYETQAAALVLHEPQARDLRELSVLENSGEVAWGLHNYQTAYGRFGAAINLADNVRVDPIDVLTSRAIVQRAQYGMGDTQLQRGLPATAATPLATCAAASAEPRVTALCSIDGAEAAVDRDDAAGASAALAGVSPDRSGLITDDIIAYWSLRAGIALDRGDFSGAADAARAAVSLAKHGDAGAFARGRADYAMYGVASVLQGAVCGANPCADMWRGRASSAWRGLSVGAIARFVHLGQGNDTFALASGALRSSATGTELAALARASERSAADAIRTGAWRESQDQSTAAAALWLRAGRAANALPDARLAYNRARAGGDWNRAWSAAGVYVDALAATSQTGTAADVCSAAIDAFEAERARLELLASQNPDLRLQQIDLGSSAVAARYEGCIALQFHAPGATRAARALRIFDEEQGRIAVRSFLASGAPRLTGVPQHALDTLRNLQGQYARARADADDRGVDPAGDATVRQIGSSVDADVSDLERVYPAFGYLNTGAGRGADWLRSLRAGEGLLAVDMQGANVFVWTVSGSAIAGERIGMPSSHVNADVGRYLAAFSSLEARSDIVHALVTSRTKLDTLGAVVWHDLISARTESAITRAHDLFVVPTGALYRVPFATMRTARGYAGDRWAFSYLSSPSLLGVLRGARATGAGPNRALLAFADPTFSNGGARGNAREIVSRGDDGLASLPQLPATLDEARDASTALATYGSSTIESGADATKERVQQLSMSGDAARYRFVLFATHAIVPDDLHEPLIVLSNPNAATGSGVLMGSDVAQLHLDADLVVLSACETGYTSLRVREGEAEFGRSFLAAGSRAVALTLWQVIDSAAQRSTSDLFTQLAAGRSPSDALQIAQTSMRSQHDGALARIGTSPYVWGAYVIFGDGFTPAPLTR